MIKTVILLAFVTLIQQTYGCLIIYCSPCLKEISTYQITTNSTPPIYFYFNDGINREIDGRISLQKASGRVSFKFQDSSTGIRSGFDIRLFRDGSYIENAGTDWSIACMNQFHDVTEIFFRIPVCRTGFPKQFNIEIFIDSIGTITQGSDALYLAINRTSC